MSSCRSQTMMTTLNIPLDLVKNYADNGKPIDIQVVLDTESDVPQLCYSMDGVGGQLGMRMDLEKALNIWTANHCKPLDCGNKKSNHMWVICIVFVLLLVAMILGFKQGYLFE